MAKLLANVMPAVRWVNATVLVVLFSALIVIAVASVVLRYVFNDSLRWGEEAMRYLFIAMTSFGAAYAVSTAEHIKLDIVTSMLPRRGRIVADALVLAAAVFFLVAVIVSAAAIWDQLGRQRWASLPLPMRLSYLPIPVGAALTLAYLGEKVWLRLSRGSGVRDMGGTPSSS